MSKTVITADMVGDPNSPLIGITILDGEDKVKVGHVYENAEDAQVVKSLRLPVSLYDAAVNTGHAAGFSGVVRDALALYLGQQDQANEVRHALTVLQRAADRLTEAA